MFGRVFIDLYQPNLLSTTEQVFKLLSTCQKKDVVDAYNASRKMLANIPMKLKLVIHQPFKCSL